MGYVIIFQDYIGLPSTDDPLIGEKVAVFKFTKSMFRTEPVSHGTCWENIPGRTKDVCRETYHNVCILLRKS